MSNINHKQSKLQFRGMFPLAKQLMELLEQEGGFTLKIDSRGVIIPVNGYAVATNNEIKDFSQEELIDWILVNGKHLRIKNLYFGGWIGTETLPKEVNITKVVSNKAYAIKLGKQTNQYSIWDIENNKEIVL